MRRFLPALVFGISFGILEAIIVIYLRQIYYPDGFQFPLVFLAPEMIAVEIVREFCTIVMLGVIGWICGKRLMQKFSFFIFTFGVWDIFYYLALKTFLDWPESLFTWDVLFLIPVTWIGPVLAPVICSFGMIIISLVSVYLDENISVLRLTLSEKLIIILGVFIILYTFIYDYGRIVIENGFLSQLFTLADNEEFWNIITNYIPQHFNWLLFALGCLTIAISYGSAFWRVVRESKKNIKS